jgi:hypothetical protein
MESVADSLPLTKMEKETRKVDVSEQNKIERKADCCPHVTRDGLAQ